MALLYQKQVNLQIQFLRLSMTLLSVVFYTIDWLHPKRISIGYPDPPGGGRH